MVFRQVDQLRTLSLPELNRILRGMQQGIFELTQDQVTPSPLQAGLWKTTVNTVGTGTYLWDTTISVTDANYFIDQNSGAGILVRKPGTYIAFASLYARSDSVTGVVSCTLSMDGSVLTSSIMTGAVSVGLTVVPFTIFKTSLVDTTVLSAELVVGDRRFAGSQLGVLKIS